VSEPANQRASEPGGRNVVRTFRDLVAWQRSMELAEAIYAATTRMPPDERFGLTNQLRRAAVSVPSNIAEGHGRQSRADYIRFLRTARGSVSEVSTQLELANRLRMLPPDQQLSDLVAEVARILQALIRSLEAKEASS
jgi:four helix bundle protein